MQIQFPTDFLVKVGIIPLCLVEYVNLERKQECNNSQFVTRTAWKVLTWVLPFEVVNVKCGAKLWKPVLRHFGQSWVEEGGVVSRSYSVQLTIENEKLSPCALDGSIINFLGSYNLCNRQGRSLHWTPERSSWPTLSLNSFKHCKQTGHRYEMDICSFLVI